MFDLVATAIEDIPVDVLTPTAPLIAPWINKLGHVGYVFIALGMFLLARKNIWGWVARWIGELIWLVIGVIIQMNSVWLWGSAFLLLETYGFYSWRKTMKTNNKQKQKS